MKRQLPTRYTILVIDDEPPVRMVMEHLLEAHEVFTFSSGEEAVEWIQVHPDQTVHVAIADYAMLGMNGVKTLRAIRELAPSAKLILMSGVVVGALDQFAAQNAFHGVMAKPFEANLVVNLIDELLP